MSSFQISYIYELIDKISPTLEKIDNSIAKSESKIKSSAQRIGESFESMGKKLDKFGDKYQKMGQKMFIKTTLPIALIGRSFINAASDYNESLNKVDVAFGNSSQKVKDFAATAGKTFGIDRGRALDMAAMFGDMATGMGMSQEKAVGLATSLTGLAGDMASFKNIRVEEAQTALAAVFTGETESLKRLGIVMTQTNLQQYALTHGIHKKIEKMKQAELVMLRYNYVVAMSKNSVGDFARTLEGSYANQLRNLSSKWRDLSIVLGSILLPYAMKFVTILQRLVDKFAALSPTTQKTILVIAGLVAVVSPLIILFGMVASGLGAIFTTLGVIIPAAIAFAGSLRLIAAVIAANPLGLFLTATAAIVYYWKDIVAWIEKAINYVKNFSFSGITDKIKNTLGFGAPLNVSTTSEQNINNTNDQRVTAGGQLDINIRNSGGNAVSSNFSAAQGNFLNVGVNSIYGGKR